MVPEERVPSVVEDYAKALYSLETRTQGAPVRTSALADRLGLSAPQVSLMCKRLAEMGLVTRSAYHGVQLTDDGRRLALQVLRHHRLLELFLADQLGMPWDRVHAEAEVLEHWVSNELEAAIAEKLGHPTVDPHGDPIPSADLVIDEGQTVSLDALRAGQAGIFVRVSDSDPGMLRFLSEKGVVPGEHMRSSTGSRSTGRSSSAGPTIPRVPRARHSPRPGDADRTRPESRSRARGMTKPLLRQAAALEGAGTPARRPRRSPASSPVTPATAPARPPALSPSPSPSASPSASPSPRQSPSASPSASPGAGPEPQPEPESARAAAVEGPHRGGPGDARAGLRRGDRRRRPGKLRDQHPGRCGSATSCCGSSSRPT